MAIIRFNSHENIVRYFFGIFKRLETTVYIHTDITTMAEIIFWCKNNFGETNVILDLPRTGVNKRWRYAYDGGHTCIVLTNVSDAILLKLAWYP